MNIVLATILLVPMAPAFAVEIGGSSHRDGPAPKSEEPRDREDGQALELPREIGPGDPREVSVLFDESHLKIATIILRDGTELEPHSAAVPATIQVLQGRGVMHVGGKAVPVSAGSLVTLPAGQEHDVVPAPASDMLLLVHYLRCASEAPGADG